MGDSPESLERRIQQLVERMDRGEVVDWGRLLADGWLPREELEALRAVAGQESTPDTDRLTGTHQLLEVLGRGAFGEVRRAYDPVLERDIAIKRLRCGALGLTPGQRERFLREARVLASFDHPNIVRIHAIEERDEQLLLYLELIDGSTLEMLVHRHGPLRPREAALIAIEICRALSVIHGQDLVHRDLKPANVMRADDGRIVLLDFGITKNRWQLQEPDSAYLAGTPIVMPPEQFEHPGQVDSRSDFYALGVLMYYLVSGVYPFEGGSFAEIRSDVLEGKSIPLTERCPGVDQRFAILVQRAMHVDPGQRYSSAASFAEALRIYRKRSAGHPRRRMLLGSLAVAAFLTTAVFLWTTAGKGGDAQPELAASVRFYTESGGHRQQVRDLSSVRAGEGVFMRIECVEDVHVYAFNEDDAGNLLAIFPLDGFQPKNPLRGGQSHRLPGTRAGKQMNWIVDTPESGHEDLIVFVSGRECPEARALWEDAQRPRVLDGAFKFVSLPTARRARLRGLGLLAPAQTASEDPGGDQEQQRLINQVQRLSADRVTGAGALSFGIRLNRSGTR